MKAAGFVLTGGKSSRMGTDKALLPWSSVCLLEDIAARVQLAAGSVLLVGSPERYRHLALPAIADRHPLAGPLGGIETALAASTADLNLIVACDMPHLSEELLRMLLLEAQRTGADCVPAEEAGGRLHPLCAVYRRSCLAIVRTALEAGQWKMHDLLARVRTVPCRTDESILNVNTPQEWNRTTHPAAG